MKEWMDEWRNEKMKAGMISIPSCIQTGSVQGQIFKEISKHFWIRGLG